MRYGRCVFNVGTLVSVRKLSYDSSFRKGYDNLLWLGEEDQIG